MPSDPPTGAESAQTIALNEASVFVIEDQAFVLDLLGRLLISLGVARVTTARAAEDALQILDKDPGLADVMLIDFDLPGMNGVRFIEQLRASPHAALRQTSVIMLTGHNDLTLYRDAAQLGIAAFLVKPAGPSTLKAALEEALAGRRVAVPGP